MADNRSFAGGAAKRWQDWANLVLALWLFISPWVLNFVVSQAAPGAAGGAVPGGMAGGAAAWNAWVLGVLAFIAALAGLGSYAMWAEWANLVFGIWIFIAPWVLGFSGVYNAAWDHWIVGALIFFIALSGLASPRPAGVGYAHAGDKPRDRP